ncbi:MAG: hypothetical protein AB8G22_18620 [Saprospiraceae bacterium]
MRGKSDLFHLIQKMSRSEKRYFTLDAQKGGSKGSKYLKLFQAINGMDEYDETKLKKKFPKNLSSDKSYLYDAILRSMRDYRSSKSYAAQIKEKLLDFRYLHELGLYDQCEERLKEAKELAEELGSTNALLEINYEERRLSNDLKRKGYEEEVERLITEKDKYLEDLKIEFEILDLHNWLLALSVRRKEIKQVEHQQRLIGQFEKRYREAFDVDKELPAVAAHRKYQCLGMYYSLIQDEEKMYEYFEKAMNWWEEHIKYKEEEHYRYILDVSNLVFASFVKGRFDNIPKLLDVLENEANENSHANSVSFQKLTNYRLMYFINTGNFDGAAEFIKKLEIKLDTDLVTESGRLVLISNAACLLFVMERYSESVEWTEKIIKGRRTEFRQDIQQAVRILNLIATYEEGEIDKMELVIRAYSRYYQEKTSIQKNDFEFIMLDYGKRLLNTVSEKKVLLELKKYINIEKQNSDAKIPAGIDDLLLFWIQSKEDRVSIGTVIKKEAATMAAA